MITETLPDPTANGWATSPSRYLRLSLFWFAISLFWSMMLGQIMQVSVERFFDAYHKGGAFALISVIGIVASGSIQLIVGPLSDRCRSKFGRRRPFLLAGSVGGSLAILAFAHAASFPALVAAFFFVQLFLNIAAGPYQALIPDLTPKDHQGRASAFMGLMQLLGEAGGPIMAGLVLANASKAGGSMPHAVSMLLAVDTAVIVALALVTMATVPDPPSAEPAQVPVNPFRNLDVRANADFFWLLLSRAAYNLGFYVALDFLSYYVQDSLGLGDTPARHTTTTAIMLISTVAALVGTFPAGYMADRISKKRIVYASCAFSTIAGLAFALAPNVPIAEFMGAFFGLGFGVFRAVDWAFACNVLPKTGGAARWMGVWSLSQLVPQAIAPAFGAVADIINRRVGLGIGWRAAMFASMFFVLVGAALVSKVAEQATTTGVVEETYA